MALTVTCPAIATVSALAQVPTYTINGLHVTCPAIATVSALAQVPTYTITDIKLIMLSEQIFPLAVARDAADNFGGGLCAYQYQEEVTLDTVGTSTPLALHLPKGFLVVQVSARVTEEITGAATWEIGDFIITDRFIPTDTTLDAGYTVNNCDCFNPAGATIAAGPIIGGQNEIYVTTDAPATSGKIRIGVAGFFFADFTS